MGTGNKSWVEKADLTVQNIIDEGGYLSPEQTKELIELQIKQSKLLGLIQTKTFSGPSFELSKIGFTGRVLRAAVESQALAAADRSRPTFGQSVLEPKEFIAEARVPYSALEDHVSQGTLLTEVKTPLSKALARDTEWVALRGDTDSADPALAKINGFIHQATTNAYAAGTVRLNKTVLKILAMSLASEYRGMQVYFTSPNACIDYGDSLASRQTPLGDENVRNASNLEYNGHAVIDIPEMPEDLGSGPNYTTDVLYTEPKNMVVGWQRQVLMETDKDVSARQWIVVCTLKFDAKFVHEPACRKATEILCTAGA